MFKTLFFTLCGLFASAAELKVPLVNFLKVSPKETLVSFKLHGSRLRSSVTPVLWSECPSLHLYDVAAGSATPVPPVVGDFIVLNLDVIFNSDADVVGNYIHLDFTAEGSTSPIALYAQDF